MSFTVSAKTRISTAVGNAKYILYMLANAANHDFECWPSLYTLSAEMGVGLTAVKSALKSLERDGHITIKARFNKSNVYKVHPLESAELKSLLVDKPASKDRETLLDEAFRAIQEKKKSCAVENKKKTQEKLMGRNPAHQNLQSMGRNPTFNGSEYGSTVSRNPASNNHLISMNNKEEAGASPSPSSSVIEEKKQRHAKNPKAKKTAGGLMTLAQYLEHCDETGAYPLPETHYVWVRAEKMGLPDELVLLDWHAFKDKYLNDQNAKNKKYADWLQHFCNSLQKNWNGLYFKKADGSVVLTTAGKNQQAIHGMN